VKQFNTSFAAAAVAAVLTTFTLSRSAPAQEPPRARGVDVSQWQGDMNWSTAYDQGIRFAFVRSSRGGTTPTGGTVTDTRFYENMSELDALAASGRPIYAGAYHYARPDTIGPVVNDATIRAHATDQAQHFVNTAGAYMTSGYLRPVLDLEVDGGFEDNDLLTPATPALSPAQMSLWANTFMNHVETLSGAEPLIYLNTSFATNEVDATMRDHDLWLARYNALPFDPLTDNPATVVPFKNPYGVWNSPIGSTTPSHDAWDFWQYTNTALGSLYGASSVAIDLDVANGGLDFVRSFLIPPSTVPEPTVALIPVAMGFALLATSHRRRR
jgi:GH25 family lysozyme M1 (1,4-beta-N-acetylmuramidase)